MLRLIALFGTTKKLIRGIDDTSRDKREDERFISAIFYLYRHILLHATIIKYY